MKKIIFKKKAPEVPIPDPPEELDPIRAMRRKALEAARLKKKETFEEGTTDKRKTPWEAWEVEKTSLRRCVNANCYDCIGAENYRNRIRFCTSFECPFWLVRPYAKGITKEQCNNWKED